MGVFTTPRAPKLKLSADIKAGEVYEFNIYHLVVVDDPLELFPIEIVET